MNIISKLFRKEKEESQSTQGSVEEFVSLIRVYHQTVIAVNLGVTNINLLSELAMFKRMLKISTQDGKLGVAEKSRARKILMQNYGLSTEFFKEIDASVKKNCKNQNSINSYFFLFQGFSNDLLMLISNVMQWKMRVPLMFKNTLYTLTQKAINEIMTKNNWKDDSVYKTVRDVRKYKETLGYSEGWMAEFVFHIVVLAKKEQKKTKKEAK